MVVGAKGLGAKDLAKQTLKEVKDDHVAAFAGHLTYVTLFAIFPFLLFIVSLLAIFGAQELVRELLGRAAATVPPGALKLIEGPILGVTEGRAQGAFTAGAIVAIAAALWGVSGAVRAVMDAMNVMYGVEERRGLVKRYLTSIALALGVGLLVIGAAVLVVAGTSISEAIAEATGLGIVFEWSWNILQWPVLAALFLLALGILYHFAPDLRGRWRWLTPGAVTAFGLWLVFSLAFGLYVRNFGSYNAVYGALAGVAILMLYIYYASFIVLVGAEVNQVTDRHASGGRSEGLPSPQTSANGWSSKRDQVLARLHSRRGSTPTP